jgi:hypothetical protein
MSSQVVSKGTPLPQANDLWADNFASPAGANPNLVLLTNLTCSDVYSALVPSDGSAFTFANLPNLVSLLGTKGELVIYIQNSAAGSSSLNVNRLSITGATDPKSILGSTLPPGQAMQAGAANQQFLADYKNLITPLGLVLGQGVVVTTTLASDYLSPASQITYYCVSSWSRTQQVVFLIVIPVVIALILLALIVTWRMSKSRGSRLAADEALLGSMTASSASSSA